MWACVCLDLYLGMRVSVCLECACVRQLVVDLWGTLSTQACHMLYFWFYNIYIFFFWEFVLLQIWTYVTNIIYYYIVYFVRNCMRERERERDKKTQFPLQDKIILKDKPFFKKKYKKHIKHFSFYICIKNISTCLNLIFYWQ